MTKAGNNHLAERAKQWLAKDVLPMWLRLGVDPQGGFVEALSPDGSPLASPRRALVQSRQIYSFRLAAEMGLCDKTQAHGALASGLKFLAAHYSHPDGGFIHAVDPQGRATDSRLDLYTQAFSLFGLAQAYAVDPHEAIRARAKLVLRYLERQRRAPAGGFTELSEQGPVYHSNPHMHLFEAAIEWMEVDSDPEWKALADELLWLAQTKMVDSKTGLLAEYFTKDWQPLREDGKFIFEPGHQFEWSWLMGRYQKLTGKDLRNLRQQLYLTTQNVRGIDPVLKSVYDQMWSDLTPKLRSSRFWPNCERIKAASQLAIEASPSARGPFARAADEALETLMTYFRTKTPGLWYDVADSEGKFHEQPAKASSLYHIIGAISEHARLQEAI
jgi:mannose-6-phosphate isomerase